MAINIPFKSGGVFITRFISSFQSISANVSPTDLVTLTPPSGQRVKLTTIVASTSTIDISIKIGDNLIITSVNLEAASAQTTNRFRVGGHVTGGVTNEESITGGIDEVLIIVLNTAAAASVLYTYQFGE